MVKITFKIGKDRDGASTHEIKFGNYQKYFIRALCDCPEDAMIERDLIGGDQLLSAFEFGYNLCRDGGSYEVERIVVSEES